MLFYKKNNYKKRRSISTKHFFISYVGLGNFWQFLDGPGMIFACICVHPSWGALTAALVKIGGELNSRVLIDNNDNYHRPDSMFLVMLLPRWFLA